MQFIDIPQSPDIEMFRHKNISGLTYYRNYITSQIHDLLIKVVDANKWDTSMRRRVQHYGYRYDYRSRKIDTSMSLGEMPKWCQKLGDKLVSTRVFTHKPDQVIVNEYNPGQGITKHVDCEPCFQGTIASLSLGSGCIMEMTECSSKEVIPIYLEPSSLLVLEGEARYKWMHSIPARVKDNDIPRTRRISLTLRNVILEG